MEFYYEIKDGKAIALNGGPSVKGTFTNRYLRVDGNKQRELKWLPKDQRHLLKAAKAKVVGSQKPIKFNQGMLTKLADLNFSEDLFKPMATCSAFDKFVSNEGGIMPGSNVMAAGAPGVG